MYRPFKASELAAKKINYFWPGVIAYGFPAYINGSTGLGKTNILLKVAADATRGIFPPGIGKHGLTAPKHDSPIRIFYVSTENPVREIVYPALLHNNADTSMIKIQKEEDGHFVLCREDLEAVMKDFEPRLIIIDAFQEHLPEGCSLSDGEHMSKLMRELEQFAYETNVALIMIGNDSKGTEGRADANKLLGSGVIARRARSLITVKSDGDERYIKVTKCLGFTKKEDTLIGYRFNNDGYLEFYPYGEERTEDEVSEKKVTVVQFIQDSLSEGPLSGDDLFHIAEEKGYSKHQIYKNLEKSKAKVKRIGAHQSYWYLPEVTPDIEAYLRSVS